MPHLAGPRFADDSYETALRRAGFGAVAGADEAGRGACAGPLVAAAVILSPDDPVTGLRDSKLASARQRGILFDQIREHARAVAVVRVEASECDRLGIQDADIQGLRRALLELDPAPDFALTDGFPVDGLTCPGLALWKGDQVAACVAAASIIAKVTRDTIMTAYDAQYPGYGFAGHKGYATRAHQLALAALGPCPIHRMTYANVVAVTVSDA
jgi:ribonuclease HII